MPKTKPISFRLDEKDLTYVQEYKEKHGIESEGKAIINIVREHKQPSPEAMKETPKKVVAQLPIVPRIERKLSPSLEKELARFCRGQHSPIVKAIFGLTESSKVTTLIHCNP